MKALPCTEVNKKSEQESFATVLLSPLISILQKLQIISFGQQAAQYKRCS